MKKNNIKDELTSFRNSNYSNKIKENEKIGIFYEKDKNQKQNITIKNLSSDKTIQKDEASKLIEKKLNRSIYNPNSNNYLNDLNQKINKSTFVNEKKEIIHLNSNKDKSIYLKNNMKINPFSRDKKTIFENSYNLGYK